MAAAPAAKRLKVDQKAAWTEARLALLEEEKALSKAKAALAAKRRALPRLEVEDYEFDSPAGKMKLSEAFGDKDQILVQHMMMADGWDKPCPICCSWIDSINGAVPHISPLAKYVLVSKAPHDKMAAAAAAKGWDTEKILLLSAAGNTFNEDFNVTFSPEAVDSGATEYNYKKQKWTFGSEAPGMSTFEKDADGKVFLTYSTFAAGLADVSLLHAVLDIMPSGRPEGGDKRNMWWLKHKEDY